MSMKHLIDRTVGLVGGVGRVPSPCVLPGSGRHRTRGITRCLRMGASSQIALVGAGYNAARVRLGMRTHAVHHSADRLTRPEA
jgi:hypothetical protein